MSTHYHRLLEFIRELKRRKVLRVITVYAASAFVILELADILAPSLRLPEWTVNLVLLLLCVGFVVAVILSWIYDIHPEAGVVKTEPVDKVKEEAIPRSSKSWKIASYISFVVIVALIVLNIIPRAKRSGEKAILDKSIAVLPFINDSPDQENMFFINGTMDAILDNLCKIEDLRVVSRTSVIQYRDNPKPVPIVAEEMNVSYVLEGSGVKYEDDIRITVQLIEAKNDAHIWSESFHRKTREIFDLQSEIAQMVADEIEAIITPEEMNLINQIPTSNLTAYEFFQKGNEELLKYTENKTNKEALERAEDLYRYALEYDSTFAYAYTKLARVYLAKHYYRDYLSEDFLDSMLILKDIALSYDEHLAEAYLIQGAYYYLNGNPEEALISCDLALDLNPNYSEVLIRKGMILTLVFNDYVKGIENFEMAIARHKGNDLPELLSGLGRAYLDVGFIEKAEQCFLEAFEVSGDSSLYFGTMAWLELCSENLEQAKEFREIAYRTDSTNFMGDFYQSFDGRQDEAEHEYEKYIEYLNRAGKLPLQYSYRIAYALWNAGRYEEADHYFKEQIKYSEESIRLGRSISSKQLAHYDLAAVYSFLGDTVNAYSYLDEISSKEKFQLWWISFIKNDPLFDSLRDEVRFQNIVQDMEAKYQAEHERVRQWLEENDML